jgi:hypothetical protein
MADNSKIERKNPVFSGEGNEGSIEALFYVEDRFRANARHLQWTTGEELFDGFGQCLIDRAETKWDAVVSTIPVADMDVARFDQAMTEYYRQWVLTDDPRDVLFDNLKTWKKPREAKVQDHVNRIEQVIEYGNRLDGNRPQMNTPEEIRQTLFESFPNAWKQDFITSRGTVHTHTKEHIVDFMKIKEEFDKPQQSNGNNSNPNGNTTSKREDGSGNGQGKRNRKRYNNNAKGNNNQSNKKREVVAGGNNQRNTKKKKYGDIKADDPCPIPWHYKKHTWKECFDNNDGPNYKPERAQQRQGNRGDQYHYHGVRGHQGHYHMQQTTGGPPPIPPYTGNPYVAPPVPDQHHLDRIGYEYHGGSYREYDGGRRGEWGPSRRQV